MGSSKNSDLIAQAQEWIEHDPDPETRSELLELIKANNTEELDDRFSRRLTFGTAGIRGIQGGGPNRMNRLTLRKVAVGISQYLRPGSSSSDMTLEKIARYSRLICLRSSPTMGYTHTSSQK